MGKWLVASAWPYINNVPHLGTMIGSVLSGDVAARFLRMKGEEVVYVSGSDEHGTPIEVEALARRVTPSALTDENHSKVKTLFEQWEISFDNYTRTESSLHKKFVMETCLKIQQNGFVFAEKTTLPYCGVCNLYLPDRFIHGECPHCHFVDACGDQCDICGRLLEPTKLLKPRCAICGNPPTQKETKQWYFDLPKLTKQLRKYADENRNLSPTARSMTLKILKEGLKPRSLTRDNKWGIPAPFEGAEDKTIYVWMEAVLGYVSATIEFFADKGNPEAWRDYWFNPAAKSAYFIGKDNVPFHTIILPALLRATRENYNFPHFVSATEFLMFEGRKFSKSRRVGIWIDEALQLCPADYWRYALLALRPENKDINFTLDTFLEKVNSDLNDIIGNFIHRTLTFIHRHFQGVVPKPGELDDEDKAMLDGVKHCYDDVTLSLENFRIRDALSSILELARAGNKYINDKAPWKRIKTSKSETASCLWVAVQVVKALGVLLSPFIPATMEVLWRMLCLKRKTTIPWDEAMVKLNPNHEIHAPSPLFRKIERSEVEAAFRVEAEPPKALKEKVDVSEVGKLRLKIGRIASAEPILKSAKLVKLKIDDGSGKLRISVAGIGQHYKPDELKDKLVVFIANVKPVKLMGIESEVMILTAQDGNITALLKPDGEVKPGSDVT